MKHGLRTTVTLSVLVLLAFCFGFPAPDTQADGDGRLSPAAAKAVQALYPGAEILEVEQEREDGVRCWEVVLRNGDETIELEVTPGGAVGEIEFDVSWNDVPKEVQRSILRETGGDAPRGVERHEIRGVPEGDTFRSIAEPITVYEVEIESDGAWREFAVTAAGLVMSEEDDADSTDGDSSSDDDSSSEDDESSSEDDDSSSEDDDETVT